MGGPVAIVPSGLGLIVAIRVASMLRVIVRSFNIVRILPLPKLISGGRGLIGASSVRAPALASEDLYTRLRFERNAMRRRRRPHIGNHRINRRASSVSAFSERMGCVACRPLTTTDADVGVISRTRTRSTTGGDGMLEVVAETAWGPLL